MGDARAAMLVAAAGDEDGRTAIAHVGARLIGPFPPEDFVGPGGADLVLIEAAGIDDDRLAVLLDRAARLDAPLIVCFAPAQIDLVAAYLIATPATLLCAPTIAERVTALAVALGGEAHRLREGGDDQARLAALHAEIARLAETITRLTREERPALPLGGPTLADRRAGFGAEPGARDAPSAAEIRALIRARRLRDTHFGVGLFEDPAWDMLLDLYAAALEGARVSVSSLCIAAAVAPTTALRWIARMTEQGLFVRAADPRDRRRAFMALSPDASAAMARYWAARTALLAAR